MHHWLSEVTMWGIILVKTQMTLSDIGLHFLYLFHPLVSAPMLCQLYNQVSCFLLVVKLVLHVSFSCFKVCLKSIGDSETAYAGGRSTISSTSTVFGNTDQTLEIGQGNMKLLFSSNGGKLTQYINKRNSVNCYFETLICKPAFYFMHTSYFNFKNCSNQQRAFFSQCFRLSAIVMYHIWLYGLLEYFAYYISDLFFTFVILIVIKEIWRCN